MYELPQLFILAYKLTEENIGKYGHSPTKHTRGLWQHNTKSIQLSLIDEDFVIKYEHKSDMKYLAKALNKHYKAISVDWRGEIFCIVMQSGIVKNIQST